MTLQGALPLGGPLRTPEVSPLKARPEALQQLDQALPESRPVADLTTRLSRFAPFEAAIGFRDRRLRSRCVTSFLCQDSYRCHGIGIL